MINKILTTVLFVFCIITAKAQLNGTYTIGGSSSNYSTFSSAVSALNSQGISGNVTFNVASGTYTENITINNFTGNATHNVVFQGAAGDSSLVTLQFASGTTTSNNFLIKFNHAKNITFKDMTLARTGSNDYSMVISLTNSSSDIDFTSLIIKNNSTNISGDYAGLVVGMNTNSSALNNFSFTKCKFLNGSYGVFLQGVSSGILSQNLEIKNNIFDGQYRAMVYAAYQMSPQINYNLMTTNSTYYNFHAIDFLYANKGPEIIGNKMNLNKGYGLYFTNSQGCCSLTGMIFNNFISMSGSGATGVFFSNSGTFHIYFNSFNIFGSSSFGFKITGSTANHNRFANNILYSNSGAKLMVVTSNISSPFDYCDYNDYKTTGMIGDWHSSTNISTLAAWKSTSGWDTHSIAVSPNFVSNTDLHIQSSAVQRAGSSMLNSPTTNIDIDSNLRHYIHPDMGAHELSYDDLTISSISVEDQMCISAKYSVKLWLKNESNHPMNLTNLPLKYKFNGNTVSVLHTISNLAVGDSIDYIFSSKINASPAGPGVVEAWFTLNYDINPSNDTIQKMVNVNNYPLIGIPVDTTSCSIYTVTLSADTGYSSYNWSTGDTSSTITVDISMLGFGGTFVSVEVSQYGCVSKDSTLVRFVDCTSIDEREDRGNFSIFPNPVDGKINLKTENNIIIKRLEIRDLTGRIVYFSPSAETSIDVSNLSVGVFILRLITDKGILHQTFIKE